MFAASPSLSLPPNAPAVAVGQTLERLRQELSTLKGTPGLGLEFALPGQNRESLFEQRSEAFPEVANFLLDEKSGSSLHVFYPQSNGFTFDLLTIAIGNAVEKIACAIREDMLLDELGTSWESLEAICEISADVLRYGDVDQALERLVARMLWLQDDLRAAVFLTDPNGRLRSVAGQKVGMLDWRELILLEKPMRESRTIVINKPHNVTLGAGIPWRDALRLAAAPLTSREGVDGFIVVWRDDTRFEFGAAFSRLLEVFAYQASMLVESDRLKKTMRENARWSQEIEIASSIQQTLLFGNPPRNLPALDVASCSAASQRIDGDFHDFLQHSDHCVDILIGDVMGKGIAAALLGAATKNQFLRAITNLAIRSRGEPPAPVAIVNRTSGRISQQLIALGRFVTVCYARFDLGKNQLDFVDCGHTGILLYRKQTGAWVFLRGDDVPMGVLPEVACRQHSYPMMAGDTYLLFSDGVTETRSPDGELFGDGRLVDCVQNWSSLGSEILLEKIRLSAAEFSNHQPLADDFTCIALTVRLDHTLQPTSVHTEEYQCGLDELARMREWVIQLGTEVPGGGLSPMRLHRLELVCTELFVNYVKHGAAGQCREPVRITAMVFPTHLTLEFRHNGVAFDPLSVPAPSFDGSRDDGFGTYIVLHCADEVFYKRTNETNLISVSMIQKHDS